MDLLITGGQVVDGTGAPARLADVAVDGDRISVVGELRNATADRVIDATGLVVCPGFIDPHSHSDWSILGNPTAQSTIRQGVTTEIVGNCGVTYAPLSDATAGPAEGALRTFGYVGDVSWRRFGELLDVVRHMGTSQNLAWFVGHSALRDAGAADPAQMSRLLEEALDAGALGMSSGLEYGSGRYATTEELCTLAEVVGRRNGMYASHIRNRDAALNGAVDEFFTIARAAGGRAQLSHLNVRDNTGAADDAWEQAVARLDHERAAGTAVLADITPMTDGLGMAAGLLPHWLTDDGPAAAASALADPEVRQRAREDCDRYWRFVHKGQWGRVTLHASPATPELEGLTFPKIAALQGKDEWDCFFDVLEQAGPRLYSVGLLGRLFTTEHVATAVTHPLFCLGVDAYTSRLDGPLATRSRHPIFYGGHVHYLAHHVRDNGTLSLEEALHKMTAMVADHFELPQRGRLAPGYYADIAVLDVKSLSDAAIAYAQGIPYVFVNGVAVVDRSHHTERRPGHYLARGAH